MALPLGGVGGGKIEDYQNEKDRNYRNTDQLNDGCVYRLRQQA